MKDMIRTVQDLDSPRVQTKLSTVDFTSIFNKNKKGFSDYSFRT